MNIRLHPHAKARLTERGATEDEVRETILTGEKFPAKYGRTGFRKNILFNGIWNNKKYNFKQIEAYAAQEKGWMVITVLVKYY